MMTAREASVSSNLLYLGELFGIALFYILIGYFTLFLVTPLSTFSAIWGPTGFAIAIMHLRGYRVWPGIALGIGITIYGISHSWGTTIGAIFADTFEAIIATYLVNRYVHKKNPLRNARDFFKFLVLAGLVATAVSATLGTTAGYLSGFYKKAELVYVWFTWWLENAGGVCVFAPFILAWCLDFPRKAKVARVLEWFLLIGLLVLCSEIVFGGLLPMPRNYPIEYLCLLPLVWSAFRFGPRGASLCVLIHCSIAIYGTYRGYGPFYRGSADEVLHLTQIYVGTNAVFTMVLSAIVFERLQLEKETARVNSELESFAYLASHDLKEPLRTVSTFSALVAQRYTGKLDSDADVYLDFIVNAAKRMGTLIDSLLEYSKFGKRVNLQWTDSSVVVDQALANLRSVIRDTKANVSRTHLPEVLADPSMLLHVFQNLIENALKFRADRAAKIRVSAHPVGKLYRFTVEDNGMGIEPQYFNKIFLLFRRGNTGSASGAGAGLAICKKIVEGLGGKIWVESTPGVGSRFHFTVARSTSVFEQEERAF